MRVRVCFSCAAEPSDFSADPGHQHEVSGCICVKLLSDSSVLERRTCSWEPPESDTLSHTKIDGALSG